MPVWLRMNWLIGFSHLNWRLIKGKQLREMIWWRDTLKTWSAKVGSEKHNNILPKKIFFFMTLLNVKGDLKCGASWSFWRVGIRGMQEFFFFRWVGWGRKMFSFLKQIKSITFQRTTILHYFTLKEKQNKKQFIWTHTGILWFIVSIV